MYIVLEYLLLENFIINFLILYLNNILLKIDEKIYRIILASVLASFYSLVFFSPMLIFLTKPLSKILISMIIVRISYRFINVKVFLKEILGFYLVSFIFAGATIGFFFSSNDLNDILYKNINIFGGFPVKLLILGVLTSTIIGIHIFKYFNLRRIRSNYIADVKLKIKEQSVDLKVLIDTGNSLVSPFSNKKVLVAEYKCLQNYLPKLVEELLIVNEEKNYKDLEKLLCEVNKEITITLIPYKSVGRSGMLIGFKPDSVLIDYLGNQIDGSGLIIGLYLGSLAKEMGYNGLLHYEIINKGVCDDYVKVQN